MSETPIIRADNLNIEYRLNQAWLSVVKDVSLTIAPLEIHGLVGESGSGKSTLALALMNYLAPNERIASGSVELDGENLLTKSTAEMRQIWGRKISLVPQDALASLNPAYKIGEQIAEITRLHQGLSRSASWHAAVEMLRRVKIANPEIVAQRYPHQLSGGMQQRVTIAMALSTEPRLLVLDEPTTALDVTTQAVIVDLFRELIHDQQAAALYVSHDLGLIAQLCDRVTVLYGGEVMASAPVIDLFKRPTHPYTISLLASLPRPTEGVETRLPTIEGSAPSLSERPHGCVFAPRCPVALQLCHDEKPPLEMMIEGRMVKCHRWREIASGTLVIDTTPKEETISAPPREGYVLQGHDLYKYFGESSLTDRLTGREPEIVRAVDDVSIRVRTRSTLGLVGESGSGKTTLARLIVGLEPADKGALELVDVPLDLDLKKRPREALRNLQMVFQNPNDALNPYMTIGQQIARTIARLSTETLTQAQVDQRVIDLLNAVRLTAQYATRYPAELSGGEKQRVAIARAFATNPGLIVADEPTSSLDVSVQSVILNLLKDLRAQQGASYLLISHNLDVVSYLADWIVVMYLGEIVEQGTVEQVYNAPSHPYTEALLSAIPVADPTVTRKQIRLEGEIPSAQDIPKGCRFHTRCPRKIGAICEEQNPPVRDAGDGHFIRCHIPIEELIEQQRSLPRERQTESS
ncbi:MAG TPA: ABC transporter ATP-binding protein [Phototrophicaceae bacterium]|nr:ABC transporter ATP-binding protein [Phototrophicaceae bacterium]